MYDMWVEIKAIVNVNTAECECIKFTNMLCLHKYSNLKNDVNWPTCLVKYSYDFDIQSSD